MFGAGIDDLRTRMKAERTLMVWRPAAPVTLVLIAVAVAVYAISVSQPGADAGMALLNVARMCLGASACLIITAEWRLQSRTGSPEDTLTAQSLFSIAILATAAAVGAIATELRAQLLTRDQALVQLIWVYAVVVTLWCSWRMATTTAFFVREGEATAEALQRTERQAHLTNLKTLQFKSGPDLMLRALSVVESRADAAPVDAEMGVVALAEYLREDQLRNSTASLPLAVEVTLARAYASIYTSCKVLPPPEWTVAPRAEAAMIPNGALRVMLDHAIGRAIAAPAPATVAVSIDVVRGRLAVTVSDTAPPDPPSDNEPRVLADLRKRIDAPRLQRVRFLTHTMLDIENTPTGTTQSLSIQLELAP